MPTYAGVQLAQPTPELSDWCTRHIPLADVLEFRHSPYLLKLHLTMPYDGHRQRPVKLGSLWWPVGASRWAIGNFIATESQLTSIRTAGGGTAAKTLVIDDGTVSISTDLWMMPPRPLSQNPGDTAHFQKWTLPVTDFGSLGEPVYLLTLVDERYYWWDKVSSITVTAGVTAWTDLFSSIASGLGITLTVDTVNADYLTPPAGLSAYSEYLPPLLDLCAQSVGHRVVRKLDGTVVTQAYGTARTSVTAQLAANVGNRLGGGQFAFDV